MMTDHPDLPTTVYLGSAEMPQGTAILAPTHRSAMAFFSSASAVRRHARESYWDAELKKWITVRAGSVLKGTITWEVVE